jgi:7-keto-8-aminopelargonate synthetase-like enzyme
MAAAGGFAAVHASVGALLRHTSLGRVFSAAMTPPDAAAALAAVEIIDEESHGWRGFAPTRRAFGRPSPAVASTS